MCRAHVNRRVPWPVHCRLTMSPLVHLASFWERSMPMRRLLVLLLLTVFSAAQQPAAPQQNPGNATAAVEKPITALPYSPSLDVNSMDKSADPCVDFYQYT